MMTIDELLFEARLADLDRELDAIQARAALLRALRGVSTTTAGNVTARAAVPEATYPWGEPGQGFVARRRAWLHRLLAAGP